MFASRAEASQPQLGFSCFPVDYLLLAKCMTRCISWMHSMSSVFSSFTLSDRVGGGLAGHEGSCGACVNIYLYVCIAGDV